jgi:transcription antitermination factor NusG
VESFLPLYERVQRWKNRQRVRLQLPLFPGYTFVRIALKDRLQVLEIPSVVRLVGFNGTPTPLADEEIEGLRQALAEGVRAESHPYLKIGRRVRITTGPLAGYEGILVRRKGTLRVVLSAELIQRSILLDVDGLAVEPVGSSPNRACPFRGERDGSGSLTPCDSSAGTSPLLRPPQQNQLTRRR